ncbi:MAG: DNA repair protein RecO [Streptococcaceae bacterium]|jgi:DNA repair protein RecO (recombination protein O)|nr:DNA repair protein RecO [Streptococcaceae bacterium]
MEKEEKAIILWTKNHKEYDKLVKIFTQKDGKLMTYARGVHKKNNVLASAIQPFTKAVYLGKFNKNSLSFLNAAKDVQPFYNIQQDILTHAHATYILGLVDAVIDDNQPDEKLFELTDLALTILDNGNDEAVITNIFEIQLLPKFGATINWLACSICGQTQGEFDYSMKYHGLLCSKHFHEDERRMHFESKVVHYLRLFSQIPFTRIGKITLKKETKQKLRLAIDLLYEEYVGLHLKSKSFLDQISDWEEKFKINRKN